METFVIRIGRQAEGTEEEGRDELRGLVEHVGSGSRQPFANTRALLAFLHANQRGQPNKADR